MVPSAGRSTDPIVTLVRSRTDVLDDLEDLATLGWLLVVLLLRAATEGGAQKGEDAARTGLQLEVLQSYKLGASAGSSPSTLVDVQSEFLAALARTERALAGAGQLALDPYTSLISRVSGKDGQGLLALAEEQLSRVLELERVDSEVRAVRHETGESRVPTTGEWQSTEVSAVGYVDAILVVDGDVLVNAMLAQTLEARGYRVVSVATGRDAKAWVHNTRPDLILLNLVLPDMDGLMLTAELESLTDAPMIAYSNRVAEVDRVLALRLGADDFIDNPSDLDELDMRFELVLPRAARALKSATVASNERRAQSGFTPPRWSGTEPVAGEQRAHTTPGLDAAALLRAQVREVHHKLDEVLTSWLRALAPDAPPAGSRVIALYIHAATVEDVTVQSLLRRVAPVYEADWAGKGPARYSTREVVPLRAYAQKVFAATDEYLAGLTLGELSETVDLSRLGQGRPTVAWVVSKFVIQQLAQISGELTSAAQNL